MTSFEQAGNIPEKKPEEKEKFYETLLRDVDILTKKSFEYEHSWQMEYDPICKEVENNVKKHKIELGQYLIEKARKSEGEERMKTLQSLNQVFNWTSLKPEEIGTTAEEWKELWDKTIGEIKESKRKSRKGLLGWIREKI